MPYHSIQCVCRYRWNFFLIYPYFFYLFIFSIRHRCSGLTPEEGCVEQTASAQVTAGAVDGPRVERCGRDPPTCGWLQLRLFKPLWRAIPVDHAGGRFPDLRGNTWTGLPGGQLLHYQHCHQMSTLWTEECLSPPAPPRYPYLRS